MFIRLASFYILLVLTVSSTFAYPVVPQGEAPTARVGTSAVPLPGELNPHEAMVALESHRAKVEGSPVPPSPATNPIQVSAHSASSVYAHPEGDTTPRRPPSHDASVSHFDPPPPYTQYPTGVSSLGQGLTSHPGPHWVSHRAPPAPPVPVPAAAAPPPPPPKRGTREAVKTSIKKVLKPFRRKKP